MRSLESMSGRWRGGLGVKDCAEVQRYAFHFDTGDLRYVLSAVCEMRCFSGDDPGLAAMLLGPPQIVPLHLAYQMVRGGIAGFLYECRCVATLSDLSVAVIAGGAFQVADRYT